MKRLNLVAVVLAFAVSLVIAPGCQKAEEAKPEATTAPKAVEKPAEKPAPKPAPKPAAQTGSQIEKETLDSCMKRNPDNGAYCRCYANEVGTRYDAKAKSGEVSTQDRGQIAVQAALACKKLNKQLEKK